MKQPIPIFELATLARMVKVPPTLRWFGAIIISAISYQRRLLEGGDH